MVKTSGPMFTLRTDCLSSNVAREYLGGVNFSSVWISGLSVEFFVVSTSLGLYKIIALISVVINPYLVPLSVPHSTSFGYNSERSCWLNAVAKFTALNESFTKVCELTPYYLLTSTLHLRPRRVLLLTIQLRNIFAMWMTRMCWKWAPLAKIYFQAKLQ